MATTTREQAFDALYNEGADGYNPYRGESLRQPAKAAAPSDDPLVMYRGLPQRRSKLVADLANAQARMSKITDQFAVTLTAKQIAELTAALA